MAIFAISVEWRTVSNVFEKSKANTRTYSLHDNIARTVCKSAIRAAVVEPVGLKANWSPKYSPSGGICIAGYKNERTIITIIIILLKLLLDMQFCMVA